MKRKTLVVFLLMIVLMSAHVYAESINIEGENYTKIGFNANITSGKNEFSNKAILTLLTQRKSAKKYEVTYEVPIEEEGTYKISATSTVVGVVYTSDYSVSVNQQEPINVANSGKLLGDFNSETFPNTMKKYEIGTAYFSKGVNTVTFIIDRDDIRSDGTLAFYLDNFTVEHIPFGIDVLKPLGPCGVYEKGKEVLFDILFYSKTPEEMKYDFKIIDFWGSPVVEDTIECRKNVTKFHLNLGSFETGWYRLCIYEGGTKNLIQETAFSVVPQLSQRVKEDTPFATDFASLFLVKSDKMLKDLVTAAKYAGISWVRERYLWSDIQPDRTTYNYNSMDKRVNVFAEAGIKILNTFHDIPRWSNFTDLSSVYQFQKNVAERYNGSIQAWEVFNEEDGGFATISADTYSAFYKAAALGVSASGADARVTFGGLCLPVENNLFIDLLMKNQANAFSDIYNLHSHSTCSNSRVDSINTSILYNHREVKMQNSENEPYWITEAGLAMPLGSQEIPTKNQLMSQARYTVVSTAQSLSTGVSKHFWFVWPAYIENKYEWGVFDKNGVSNPVYASEAIMSYMLGKGIFKGSIEEEGVEGYLFDSGKNDVLVTWTSMPKTITLKSDTDVIVTDLMGQEKTVKSIGGNVKIDISYYPTYISFDKIMSTENYYHKQYHFDENRKTEYTDAQRIILQQKFENQEQAVVKLSGYELKPNEKTDMSVVVYNFNEKEMIGKISGELNGYEVRIQNPDIIVAPMSNVTILVTLVPVDKPIFNQPQYLKFVGEFDGNITSPTVSAVVLKDIRIIKPKAMLEGQNKSKNWNLENITGTGRATAKNSTENGVIFDVSFSGGDRWFYPKLAVTNPHELQDTDGIAFWIKADKESVSGGSHNVFAYMSDGRQYFLGNVTGILMKDEWIQVKRSWSEFVKQFTPLGNADLRPFDPTLIQYISIGGNFGKNSICYEIKDFGYFVEDNKQVREKIEFSGIENMKKYKSSELKDIKVTLPKCTYKKIKVMISDEIMEPVSVNQNHLQLDMSELQKGEYILRVTGEDASGYIISENLRFFVTANV